MSDSEIFETIMDGMNNHFPMVAGTGGHTTYGIVHGHAFTVLGGHRFRENGRDVDLILMRNPWGKFMYTGPYSTHWGSWNSELKAQYDRWSHISEGVFFVPVSIWRQNWHALTKQHYRDDWHTSETEGNTSTYDRTSRQTQEWVTFTNPTRQDLIIECS